MNSNELREYKKGLKLNSIQREIIVGTLLGDAHLASYNKINYSLMFQHGFSQQAYVQWKYSYFKQWVLTPPKVKNQIVNGKLYQKVWFSTLSHIALRFYGKLFYINRKKVVPVIISKLLTPLGLAVWFMDDGSIKSKEHRALILNTQCYTNKDLSLLQQTLFQKFGIKTKLRKQKEGYQIYILSETVEIFVKIIRPYIIPEMEYKLGKLR